MLHQDNNNPSSGRHQPHLLFRPPEAPTRDTDGEPAVDPAAAVLILGPDEVLVEVEEVDSKDTMEKTSFWRCG